MGGDMALTDSDGLKNPLPLLLIAYQVIHGSSHVKMSKKI